MQDLMGNVAGEKNALDSQNPLHADFDFVRLLKQEDEAALDQLWENLYRDAVYIARRYSQPDDMGYDAAVKTYDILIRRGIASFGFQSSFRRYCWIILTRELFRLIKKEIPFSEVEVPEIPTSDDKPLTVNAQTVWERIKECVERLKGNRKAVFEAVDLKGEAPSMVAEGLGLSRNNVNQLTSRARRDVRQCLENLGYKSVEDVISL